MSSKFRTCSLAAIATCALGVRAAGAGGAGELTLGAGVVGFTDHTMRDATSPVGGLWELRASFNTRAPISFEVGYLGSATPIQSLFGTDSATMIGTTFEGDVRLDLLPRHRFDPYVFAGIGWQRYNIDERSFSLSDTGIANSDDVVEVPVGGGIAYRFAGLVADARGTFRATRGSSLVLEEPAMPAAPGTSAMRFAPMHSWEASLALGYEF